LSVENEKLSYIKVNNKEHLTLNFINMSNQRPPNGPSTTGNASGKGRGNNPPSKPSAPKTSK
jgi:hypothetical protein